MTKNFRSKFSAATGTALIDGTIAQFRKMRESLESGIEHLTNARNANDNEVETSRQRHAAFAHAKAQENGVLDAKMEEARHVLAALPGAPREKEVV